MNLSEIYLFLNAVFGILLVCFFIPIIYEYIRNNGIKVIHIVICVIFYKGFIGAIILGSITCIIYFTAKLVLKMLNITIIRFNKVRKEIKNG